MNPETRRKTLLIALGALLLIGAWRSLQPLLGSEETVAAVAVLPPGLKAPRPAERLATLHLASLDHPSPGSATAGRDLWRFIDPPAPARKPETVPVLPSHPENPPLLEAPTTLIPPPQPTVSLTYLGNFGPAGKKIAVLSNGQQIYNAQEGDVIDGKLIVARIGYESVDIRFVDFPDVPAQRVGVR
jgi:hypothetical protein